MSASRTNWLGGVVFPREAGRDSTRKPSEVEREVIQLFDELRDPALRYVLSFGLSIQDGEEVTQEVFLALLRHLQMGKARDNLRGWIFRVAHNLALKRRQANQRSVDTSERNRQNAENQLDSAWNPEERLSVSQRQERLLSIFRALPEKDQCCLRLRAEGLRYREIAAVLDMSLGAVSNSLTRSIARMIDPDGT
ncbi:MAG: sigma-70 family RNA polymerase sigma factor [Candidatus Acidiferrales bacterium]